jgi:DNA (cytosine-5)-methyltransferase 1
MKAAGLFAGIGGFELGLMAGGHECHFLCEFWAPAKSVLSKRFPNSEIHDDVRSLKHLPSDTEILTAGFPCQDLSQAGMTKGITGAKSSLVSNVFRLLDKQSIPLVILENVSFMLSLDQGQAMRVLVNEFEQRGYRWAYRVVSSLAFLPQRRERVFFVASRCDLDPSDIIFCDDKEFSIPESSVSTGSHGFYWTEGIRGLGWAVEAIPTLKNGSTIGIPSPPAILLQNGLLITPDIRDAERFQGFPVDWTKPAIDVGRASLRWSLVGNAVSVPCARWIGKRITAPGKYDKSRDITLDPSKKWPLSARFDGINRFSVKIGKFPVSAPRKSLSEFLKYPGIPLSARATRGFLSRTERSTLRFPIGFKEALRSHLERMEGSATSIISN